MPAPNHADLGFVEDTPAPAAQSAAPGNPHADIGFVPEVDPVSQRFADWHAKHDKDLMVSPEESAAQHRGAYQGLTFGHEPQIYGAYKALTGGDYLQARDAEIAANQEAEKNYPSAYHKGQLGGGLLISLPSGGVGAGKTALARIAQGVETGATYGALQNPGDTPGEINPIQAKERSSNAILGGMVGGGISALNEGLHAAAEPIKKWAGERAAKASGFIKSSLNKLSSKVTPAEIGQQAMDMGLVQPGDTVHSVAEKAQSMENDIGQKIGALYDEARAQSTHVGGNLIDKNDFADGLKEAVRDPKFLPTLDRKQYLSRMDGMIDEIASNGDVSDARYLQQVKTDLQNKVKWAKRFGDLPENQKGYTALQSGIRDSIGDILDALGKRFGQTSREADLAELNHAYGIVSTINDAAQDAVKRDIGNRWLTPSSYGTGALGAMAGLAAPAEDNMHRLEHGAIGFGLGIANKAALKFGNSTIAPAAYSLGTGLQSLSSEVPSAFIANQAAQKKSQGYSGQDAYRGIGAMKRRMESSK